MFFKKNLVCLIVCPLIYALAHISTELSVSGSKSWPIVYLSKSLAYVCQVFDIRNELCYNRFR